MDNLKVELSGEEKEILKAFHESKRKELLSQLSKVDSKIKSYGGDEKDASQKTLPFNDGFPKFGSLPERTIFAFKSLKKESTIREIYERLSEFDPSIKKDGKNDSVKYRQVYSAILNKKGKGEVYKVDNIDPAHFGIVESVNEEGKRNMV